MLITASIQPFCQGRLGLKHEETGSYSPQLSHQSYRTNSSLIDADSEDEDVLRPDAAKDVDKHHYLGHYRINKSPSNNLPTPSWTTSDQVKEIKEQFKYTDTDGNDLWACVKTVYNNDGRQVYILNDDGSGREVSLNPLPGQCIYERGDYDDLTKYWRDHHVPEYSIERSKPVVLRDAYVPEYSRLSARAQAWRGFTKPKAALTHSGSSSFTLYGGPSSTLKDHPGGSSKKPAGTGRSFHKYRNRRRRGRNFKERTKINLATLVPQLTPQKLDEQPRETDKENRDEPFEHFNALIIENLPNSLTNAYIRVSSLKHDNRTSF